MTEILLSASIGGLSFTPDTYNIRGGSYGSVGTADMTTSVSALEAAGIDLPTIAMEATGLVEVSISVGIDGSWTKIFGGEYEHAVWSYDEDTVNIFCRDWAGVLIDEKRVLSMVAQGIVQVLAPGEVADPDGVSTQSQNVSQVVTAIAKQFGFTPIVDADQGTDPELSVGSFYGGDDDATTFMPLPQSLWNILNRLARDTGNEVYVTPKKELVFTAPGANRPTINVVYKSPTMPPTGILPIRNLSVQHNPRRNMSFRVLVVSYDPSRAEATRGDAYVIGTKMPGSSGTTINPGLWPGTNGAIALQLKQNGQRIQLYTFHLDGLTSAQAQQRALSIAQDIAKREFILSGIIDGYPDITPLQTLKIQGEISPVFLGRDYFVSSYVHTYSMHDGFNTNLSALDIQAFGIGEMLTQ